MDNADFSFKNLHDQAEALDTLTAMLKTGKIPNALAFTGSRGSGRKEAGFLLAAAINCNARCNEKPGEQKNILQLAPRGDTGSYCLSCRKIFSGVHPDIIMVSPEKEVIKIHQIRAVYASIAARPHEAKMRMVMIEDAEKMNAEAGNALLKILEEPPDTTFFILLASDISLLLPTIISRCRHIRFKPVSSAGIVQRLMSDHGIDKETARIAANSSCQSMERALKMLNLCEEPETDWLKRRKWLLTQLTALLSSSPGGENPFYDDLTKALCPVMLAEKLSQDTELIRDSLVIIRTFLRDIAIIGFNHGQIINSDEIDNLETIMNSTSSKKTISWLYSLSELEKKLNSNAVIRLLLEQFFLELASG